MAWQAWSASLKRDSNAQGYLIWKHKGNTRLIGGGNIGMLLGIVINQHSCFTNPLTLPRFFQVSMIYWLQISSFEQTGGSSMNQSSLLSTRKDFPNVDCCSFYLSSRLSSRIVVAVLPKETPTLPFCLH